MTLISQNFTVDASSNLIFDILRNKIYSDPVKSIVQEIISNARDANREAGNNHPVKVLCNGQKFSVKDNGLGISPDRMEKVFLQYLVSSKTSDNHQTGGFGLGAKTPFAYTDSFEIVTVNNGIKYQYLASIGGESNGGEVLLVSSEPTTESSGTEIVVPLNSSDHAKFNHNMTRFMEYFNTPIEYTYYGVKIDYPGIKIIDSVQLPGYRVTTFVVLDGIYYPLDRNKITSLMMNDQRYQKYGRDKEFILSFGSRELDVSVNREAIRFSDTTNEAIRKKISDFFYQMEETAKEIIPNLVEKDYINNYKKIPKESLYCFQVMKLNDFYLDKVYCIDIDVNSTPRSVGFGIMESCDYINTVLQKNKAEIFTLDQKAEDLSTKEIKKYIKSKSNLDRIFITKISGYPVTSSAFKVKEIDKKSRALFFKADQYGSWRRVSYNDIDTSKKSLLLKQCDHSTDYIAALACSDVHVYALKDQEMIDRFADESWVSFDHHKELVSLAEKYDQEYADFVFMQAEEKHRYSSINNYSYNLDRNLNILKQYIVKYPDTMADGILALAARRNVSYNNRTVLFKVLAKQQIEPKAVSNLLSYADINKLASTVEQYLKEKIPLFCYIDFNRVPNQNYEDIIRHL